MKVIFTQDVQDVAKSGQLKEVADGYARNFLFPRNLAVMATAGTLNAMAAKMEARAKADKQAEADARKLADEINGKEIVIEAKKGEGERLYGSVTNVNIADAIQAELGFDIDKRKIKIKDAIHQVGSYNVELKLAKDINPVIKVVVKGEQSEEEAKVAEKTEETVEVAEAVEEAEVTEEEKE